MAPAIGAGIVALLGSVGVSVSATFGTVIGGLLLTGAAVAAQILLAPRPPRPKPERMRRTEPSEEGPGRWAFGRVRVASKIMYGNTADHEIYQLAAHYFGPTSAIEEYYLEGRPIVVDPDGSVSSPPYVLPGGSYIQIQTLPGDGTETAWSDLVSAFPSKWTSSHALEGIAQSLVQYTNPGTGAEKFNQLFGGSGIGGVHELERLDRAGAFYDPRELDHDPDDVSTWAWSMNAALIWLHFRRMRPGIESGLIADQSNEITNGSFGTNIDGWEADAASGTDPTLSLSSNRLRLTTAATGTNQRADWTVTDLTPGQVCFVSCSVAARSTSFAARIGIEGFEGTLFSQTSTTGTRSFYFIASAASHTVHLMVPGASPGAGEWVEFDDVVFQAQPTSIDYSAVADAADDCDAEVETITGENLAPFDDDPDSIIDDGGTGAYNNSTWVFTNTGTSNSAVRPIFRWDTVFDGAKDKYGVRYIFTGDFETVARLRIGDTTVDIGDAETNATTWNGLDALEVIASADPDGGTILQVDFDGTGGDFHVRLRAATVYEITTTPRAQLSGGGEGEITTEFLAKLLESAGLEEYRTDAGLIACRLIEDYPDAEITLSADHLTKTLVRMGPEGVERPNVCRVKYFSAEREYQPAEIPLQVFQGAIYSGPSWARLPDEIDVYGEKEMPIELDFCPNAGQALRIGRRLFHMARARSGAAQTDFVGLACWGLYTADLELPDLAADGGAETVRVRLDAPRVNDAQGTVELAYAAIPDILQTAYDPARDEVEPPPVLEPTAFEAELDTPATPTVSGAARYPGAGTWEMRVLFDGGSITGATQAEANYRMYSGGLPGSWTGMTERGLDQAFVAGDLRGDPFDFRVRVFNVDDEGSYFSENLFNNNLLVNNTTPSQPGLSVIGDAGEPPFTVTITAPSEISVVAIDIVTSNATGLSSQTVDAYPGEVIVFNDVGYGGSGTMTIDVTAETTDETASTAADFEYNPPPP